MSRQYFQEYFGTSGRSGKLRVKFEELIIDGVQKHYCVYLPTSISDWACWHFDKVVVVVFCGVVECRIYHKGKTWMNGIVFSHKVFPRPESDFKNISLRDAFFQDVLGPMLHERLNRAKGIRPMTTFQPSLLKETTYNTLFDTFLTMSSLQLPVYVMVWITDWLYGDKVISLHKKVALFERISKSVVKAKQKKVKLMKTTD